MSPTVPLSHLELDVPAPVFGWLVELDRLGVAVVDDDLGRRCVSRAAAREIILANRENEARQAQQRQEAERQAVERDQQFRARLPGGIPAGAVPSGVSAAELMMLSDPMGAGSRRESVLEHALARRGDADALARGDGEIVYHPIQEQP